jgi:Ppx/GppA phosphatase family
MGWDGLPAVEKPLDSGGAVGSGVAASAPAKLARGSGGCAQPAAGGELTAARRSLRYAAPRFGAVVAALDLGTNNCRLLVARPAGNSFRVVDAFSRIVRLGEGLAASGVLSEEAIARTLDALQICAGKIAFRRIASGRYVATEACRRATNCDEFLARVRAETGLDIEIISTPEEARLVVSGCAPLLNPRIPYAVVFDIGGGSTEIVLVRLEGGRDRRRCWVFDRGCLGAVRSFSPPPPPAPAHPRLDVAASWRCDLDRPLWWRGFAGDLPHDGRGGLVVALRL